MHINNETNSGGGRSRSSSRVRTLRSSVRLLMPAAVVLLAIPCKSWAGDSGSCGNGVCNPSEDCMTCPADCGPCDPCDPDPCVNGICVADTVTFTCDCDPGYTGTFCEVNIDECDPDPCQNGGVCTDLVNAYSCQCQSGYTGTNCEVEIDECEPMPCLNGGICTDLISDYTCECQPGYFGDNCEQEVVFCDNPETIQCSVPPVPLCSKCWVDPTDQTQTEQCCACEDGDAPEPNGECIVECERPSTTTACETPGCDICWVNPTSGFETCCTCDDGDPPDAGVCPVCGNGTVELGEDCDGGPCCESDCTFSATSTSCGSAGSCSQFVCDGAGQCVEESINEGFSCGPGDLCNVEVCRSGSCVLEPANEGTICGVGDHCNDPVCRSGTCTEEPANEGQPCGPSDLCIDQVCRSGVCEIEPANEGNQCGPGGVCNTEVCRSGSCVTEPLPEGTPDCGTPGICNAAECNGAGACTLVPAFEGESCGPGDPCNAEVCRSGSCVLEPQREGEGCPGSAGPCRHPTCQSGACLQTDVNEGLPCGSASSCEQPFCRSGVCVDEAIVCNDDNPCTEDACDPDTNICEFTTTCTGACCFDEPDNALTPRNLTAGDFQSCQVLTEKDCINWGGTYQGTDVPCTPGLCEPKGACCVNPLDEITTDDSPDCMEVTEDECINQHWGVYKGDDTVCHPSSCHINRLSETEKGSLLIFSDIEIEWIPGIIAGTTSSLRKDTILSLTNDFEDDVRVQMYFINGDAELDPVFAGDPPILISEGEPGWNWVDCALELTQNQSIYWSAATGLPAGCQPFPILDPDGGSGPGRPNPEANDGSRILRGFILAWAVDSEGNPIRWNHLSGKGTIVDYVSPSAWEYNTWAAQVQADIPNGARIPIALGGGVIQLNGDVYDAGFDQLLLDFIASGASIEVPGANATFDTDLTLHTISADLRQDTRGPVTTKANFDIWNTNERKFSGTHRCVTCWDQTLLSNYDPPRTFLIDNLQSDKGKARIDGLQSQVCELNCVNEDRGDASRLFGVDVTCSHPASLLGVAVKEIGFSGAVEGRAIAGSNLVGEGVESATICIDDSACDDGVECTIDHCDVIQGCIHELDDSVCDDGLFCNGIESCSPGGCVAVSACPPVFLECGALECDEANDECFIQPDDDDCPACFRCSATGSCEPLDCTPPDACTISVCDPQIDACLQGSVFCIDEDNDVCTGVPTCDPVLGCQDGAPLDCDDGNACTTDSCDPVAGCMHVNNTIPCDDGVFCTVNDTCANGTCTGEPRLCDDNNPCTDDSCSGDLCVFTPNTQPCDDGNACTIGDMCSGGICISGSQVDCNDNNVCTNDSCDPAAGCMYVNNTVPCDDGLLCTVNDRCADGTCIGEARDCDDGVFCNGSETCDPVVGCGVFTCGPCGCVAFECGSETCDEANDQCVITPNDADCDDGNDCTINTCDSTGTCVSDPVPACTMLAIVACDDGDNDTFNDEVIIDVCTQLPCSSCAGIPTARPTKEPSR